jgi:hypothetical protein
MTTTNPGTSNDGSMPKPGIYKAKGIEGQEQYGYSSNGNPELIVRLSVPALSRQLSTALYLTPDAYPYSVERLRSLGWEGDDLRNLKGIGQNEVDIQITYEMYDNKMTMKVQIMGGGTFNTKTPAPKDEWFARVQALTGLGRNGAAAGDEPDPDFG